MNNCPICESNAIRQNYMQFTYAYKEFSLSRCTNCKCMLYSNDFFFDFKENFEHNRSLKTYLEKTSDLESLITIIYNFFTAFPERTGSGIDIGCGVGIVMDFSQTSMGRKMTGFEPSSHYSREGRETLKLDIIEDFFKAEYLRDKKIDFAVCLQVVQMEKNPVDFVKEIRQAISENGILLLSTPDNSRLNEHSVSSGFMSELSPGVHRYIFSEESLVILLGRAGFKNIKVYKRDGQLFALASQDKLEEVDLFSGKRDAVIGYYTAKLAGLSEETSYFKGIWYRLYRNRIDYGEYKEAMDLLQSADWFEIWTEGEIKSIQTMDKLFELNSSADAIIYYYTGILFLNYLEKYDYSERFFLLSYLLSLKVMQFQSEMGIVERDIVWLAKWHYVISALYRGDKHKARNELIELITPNQKVQDWLPKPPQDLIKKAKQMLKELN